MFERPQNSLCYFKINSEIKWIYVRHGFFKSLYNRKILDIAGAILLQKVELWR